MDWAGRVAHDAGLALLFPFALAFAVKLLDCGNLYGGIKRRKEVLADLHKKSATVASEAQAFGNILL